MQDDMRKPAGTVSAGMAVDNVNGTTCGRHIVGRNGEQKPILAVETLGRLFERNRRSHCAVLERTVPVIAPRVARKRINRRRSADKDDAGETGGQCDASCDCRHPLGKGAIPPFARALGLQLGSEPVSQPR
jgi:hypothetical protein